MPRKRRSNNPVGISAESIQKIGAIAQKTEEETYDALICDFDVQAEKLKKQFIRLFRNDVRRMLQYLPQKTSIPKEILTMSAYEFKERGGSVGAVMESLRQGQTTAQLPPHGPSLSNEKSVTKPVPMEPVPMEPVPMEPVPMEIDPCFVTPALNTRSRGAIATLTETAKRKPRALEQVALSVYATDSGSPVDEEVFMKLQIGHAVESFQSQLLEGTTSFPQKWRSQLQMKIKQASVQYKSQLEGQLFQTPAMRR